jgi:hypothetical protein
MGRPIKEQVNWLFNRECWGVGRNIPTVKAAVYIVEPEQRGLEVCTEISAKLNVFEAITGVIKEGGEAKDADPAGSITYGLVMKDLNKIEKRPGNRISKQLRRSDVG